MAMRSEHRKTILVIQDTVCDDRFEQSIERMATTADSMLECFRCEDAWIWDAYGSMARTVLLRTHRAPEPSEIWVMGWSGKASPVSLTDTLSARGSKDSLVSTVTYLMKHVVHVDPAAWLPHQGDKRGRVQQTAELLQQHPLKQESVQVKGYLFHGDQGEFEQVWPMPDTTNAGVRIG